MVVKYKTMDPDFSKITLSLPKPIQQIILSAGLDVLLYDEQASAETLVSIIPLVREHPSYSVQLDLGRPVRIDFQLDKENAYSCFTKDLKSLKTGLSKNFQFTKFTVAYKDDDDYELDTDSAGHVLDLNPEFYNITGFDHDSIIKFLSLRDMNNVTITNSGILTETTLECKHSINSLTIISSGFDYCDLSKLTTVKELILMSKDRRDPRAFVDLETLESLPSNIESLGIINNKFDGLFVYEIPSTIKKFAFDPADLPYFKFNKCIELKEVTLYMGYGEVPRNPSLWAKIPRSVTSIFLNCVRQPGSFDFFKDFDVFWLHKDTELEIRIKTMSDIFLRINGDDEYGQEEDSHLPFDLWDYVAFHTSSTTKIKVFSESEKFMVAFPSTQASYINIYGSAEEKSSKPLPKVDDDIDVGYTFVSTFPKKKLPKKLNNEFAEISGPISVL